MLLISFWGRLRARLGGSVQGNDSVIMHLTKAAPHLVRSLEFLKNFRP
jgi:hypothetical protein